jgi:hypothetical protein
VSDSWRICCTWLYLVETQISEWSKREELVVGRSFDPLVVLIHLYKKRHDIILLLVYLFGGCSSER